MGRSHYGHSDRTEASPWYTAKLPYGHNDHKETLVAGWKILFMMISRSSDFAEIPVIRDVGANEFQTQL